MRPPATIPLSFRRRFGNDTRRRLNKHSRLQNWVVDTDLPANYPDTAPDLPADWRRPRCKQPKTAFGHA